MDTDCMYTFVYVFAFAFVFVYTYVYVYTHIYIYTQPSKSVFLSEMNQLLAYPTVG